MCLKWKNIFIRKSSFEFKTFSPWTWYPYFGLSSKHLCLLNYEDGCFKTFWSAVNNDNENISNTKLSSKETISVLAGRDEWSMNEKGFLRFVKRNFVQERRCHYTQAVYIVYVAVIVFSTCIYIYIQNILKTKQSLSLVLRLPQTGFNSDTIWIIHCRIFQKPFDVMQHNKQL